MDGELRYSESGEVTEGETSKNEYRIITNAELSSFLWEQFPIFLSFGMTAEQYWDGDNRLPRAYKQADKLKRIQRNNEDYRLGAYFYDALCAASPLFRLSLKGRIQANPYLSEPYPIDRKEAEEREEKKREINRQKFIDKLKAEVAKQEKDKSQREAETNNG